MNRADLLAAAWPLRTALEARSRPAPLEAPSRAQPARLESTWAGVDGLRVHVRAARAAAPPGAPDVVFVHGVGVSGRYLAPTAVRLARHCRVHVPDLPGFGLSDRPQRLLGLCGLAEALVAVTSALGLERPAVVANSFGCQIAVQAAVADPGGVGRLVLVGPTVDAQARTARCQLMRWIANGRHERPSQALLMARDYADAGLRRAIATFRLALSDRIEDKLPLVRAPTLVVRGERDLIVPQSWAECVADVLPQGRLVVVPGAGHTVNYSAPEELARAIRPFVGGDVPTPA